MKGGGWIAGMVAIFVLSACGADETVLVGDTGLAADAGVEADASADATPDANADAASDATPDAFVEDDVHASDADTPEADADGNPEADASDVVADTVTVEEVSEDCVPYEAVAPLFVSNGCTNSYCHGGPTNASGLGLEDGYASLVNVGSVGAPGETRVVPGDPDASYLIHKVEGTASAGNPMPPIGEIASEDVEALRAWIQAGAAEFCP
jgi:hypothetical protein